MLIKDKIKELKPKEEGTPKGAPILVKEDTLALDIKELNIKLETLTAKNDELTKFISEQYDTKEGKVSKEETKFQEKFQGGSSAGVFIQNLLNKKGVK